MPTQAVHTILDSHFHWYPRDLEASVNRLRDDPRRHGPEWYDLEGQLQQMDALGRQIDVWCWSGVFSAHFAELELAMAREFTRQHNELMADAQRRHRGRVWSGCVVPIQDTNAAIEELTHAIEELGLVGVSLPAYAGLGEWLDAERLEPFYAEVERLGIPIFLHPTDTAYADILDGYAGALHLSLGRVIDVSVCAFRLILSGIMERYPDLKVIVSHTGGALPYQAGRLDKNSTAVKLPEAPSTYLRRMFTDTVSPHQLGVEFALRFFGSDHILYGSDYPCWDPAVALRIVDAVQMRDEDRHKVMYGNAREMVEARQHALSKGK